MFVKSVCILVAVGVAAAQPLLDINTLQCDPAGQIPLLLPHFSDCNKYFHCDNGREVERSCPASLIFDFGLQTCNWEWATTCMLRDSEQIEGSGDDGESSGDGSGSGSGDAATTSSVHHSAGIQVNNLLDCDSADGTYKQLPYVGDCQRYWRCRGRTLEAVYCSDGLYFNPQRQQCDFEANVKCEPQATDELEGEFIVYK